MNKHLGTPHLHYAVCESTNDVAKNLAEKGAAHGLIVTADEQTAGRGRQGRVWVAPPKTSLLLSALARPVTDSHKLAPLAAALAVAETCDALADVKTTIKWPNDVWIEGRKVSGILAEARPDHSPDRSWLVVGIGLNTSVRLEQMPEDLQQTAATLGLDTCTDVLTPLVARLDHWLTSEADAVIAAWRTRDALLGRTISWADGAGVAAGIDEHGNLIVKRDDGSANTLTAGEVHLTVDA